MNYTNAIEPTISPSLMIIEDENDTAEQDISSLSEAQDMALSLTPLFSGLLSAWGSANIIYMVYMRRRKSKARIIDAEAETEDDGDAIANNKHGCYERIMLGLSVFDLISSLAIALQAFVLPSDTSDRIWASGTDATCTAMGFFQQLSLANMWYTGFLSVFFLLTIKYSISEHYLSKCIEPMFHFIAIGYAVSTASAGIVMDAYGEMDTGHYCYIRGDYPQATLLMYIFAAIPTLLVLMAVIICNLLIYCYMRRLIQKENKIMAISHFHEEEEEYNQHQHPKHTKPSPSGKVGGSAEEREETPSSSDKSPPNYAAAITLDDNSDNNNGSAAKHLVVDGKKGGGGESCTVASSSSSLPTVAASSFSVATTAASSSMGMTLASAEICTTATTAASPPPPPPPPPEENDCSTSNHYHHHYHHHHVRSNTTTINTHITNIRGNNSNGSSVISNVARIHQEQKREEQRQRDCQQQQYERQTKRLQAVANQAFLYVGGFLLTQLPLMIMGFMKTGKDYQAGDEASLFPGLMLRAILWPLQGLFNYFIFIRPSYLREM